MQEINRWFQNNSRAPGLLDKSLRAIVTTVTFYHQQTDYFININALIEQGASGNIKGTVLQVTPFKIYGMKNEDNIQLVRFYLVLRCLCVLWVIANSFVTWGFKKKSLNDKTSFQAVNDLYMSMVLMVCQLISIYYTIFMLNTIPFAIDDLD